MKNSTVFILTAIGFGGIGTAAGYLLARKKYLNKLNNELKAVEKAREDHDDWLLGLYGINRIKSEKHEETSENKADDVSVPDAKEPSGESSFNNYSDIAKQYQGESGGQNQKKTDPVCYEITPEEFDASEYNYEQLYYYPDVGITDSDNNVLPQYKDLIGPEELWINTLRKNNIVYIRNDTNLMDYEISFQSLTWDNVASPSQKASSLLKTSGELRDDD